MKKLVNVVAIVMAFIGLLGFSAESDSFGLQVLIMIISALLLYCGAMLWQNFGEHSEEDKKMMEWEKDYLKRLEEHENRTR